MAVRPADGGDNVQTPFGPSIDLPFARSRQKPRCMTSLFTICSPTPRVELIFPNEPVMADQIVITEKFSQAKDVRAAVGSRYGDILPAEGHLLDLLEPEDVVPEWKRWSPILLRPEGLYGTRPAQGDNKAAKLKVIREALRTARKRVSARNRLRPRGSAHRSGDSREHYEYRGQVMRVLFTAQGLTDHPRRIRSGKTKWRICPPVRRRSCEKAGRPNLQSVTDPYRDRDSWAGFAPRHRRGSCKDADPGHCVQT